MSKYKCISYTFCNKQSVLSRNKDTTYMWSKVYRLVKTQFKKNKEKNISKVVFNIANVFIKVIRNS
jgi:hypothetical protein